LLDPPYRFKKVAASPTLVKYENDDAFVNVYHGRQSYGLGVEFGRRIGRLGRGLTQLAGALRGERGPFQLEALAQVKSRPDALGQSWPVAPTSREELERHVPVLASALRDLGDGLLRGAEPDTFRRLAAHERKRSRQWTRFYGGKATSPPDGTSEQVPHQRQ
jgi:hypothetical protein